MPSFILTGTPGAGKTAALRQLELDGYLVVEEAATDVIALEQALGIGQPLTNPAFIDNVVRLQRMRQTRIAVAAHQTAFFDRSPVCTLALSKYLGFALSSVLEAEIERVLHEAVYDQTVFFVRALGGVRTTAARQISFADSLDFELLHEKTYRDLGFRLVDVPAAPVQERVELIHRFHQKP
ncbi:MAG: ATP/GTP-binding protein [Acidothermaceae bacterium]